MYYLLSRPSFHILKLHFFYCFQLPQILYFVVDACAYECSSCFNFFSSSGSIFLIKMLAVLCRFLWEESLRTPAPDLVLWKKLSCQAFPFSWVAAAWITDIKPQSISLGFRESPCKLKLNEDRKIITEVFLMAYRMKAHLQGSGTTGSTPRHGSPKLRLPEFPWGLVASKTQ